jgi:hypothetical protein
MPITVPGLAATLLAGLAGVGDIGIGSSQLALGLAIGTFQWLQVCPVVSVDVGTLGSGVGIGPFIVPPTVLIPALIAGFTSSGINGIMSAPTAIGLAQGFSLGFTQGLVVTANVGIGLGGGTSKLVPTPAFPFIQAGLTSAGCVGISAVQIATAVTTAFTQVFGSLVFPIVVTGPPSIIPSGGAGIGKVT